MTKEDMITACSGCDRVRQPDGTWKEQPHDNKSPEVSHGICPECAKRLYGDLLDD